MTSGKEDLLLFTPPILNFKERKSKGETESKCGESEEYPDRYDPLIFCRTCAKMDPCLVPIFQQEGSDYCLMKKIEKYLPIQVTEEDELPVHVCYHCASMLVAWDAMVVGCIAAEKKLNSLRNHFESEKRCDEMVEALTIETVDSDDEPLVAKKIFKDVREQKSAISGESNETGDILREKDDVQAQLLLNSIEPERDEGKLSVGVSADPDDVAVPGFGSSAVSDSDSPDTGAEPAEKTSTACRERKIFRCDICKKAFNRRFNFERHLVVHTGETLTCHTCGKQYRRRSVLDRHVKVVHQHVRLAHLSCSGCGKTFSSSQSLEDHRRTHTGERPFICEVCGKDFRARPNLIAHKKIHTGELPFACSLCEYRCRLKSTFVDHCQRHEGTRTCLCSVCGKGFVNRYDLMKHKKTHAKERLFACPVCSLTFVMKRYLKVHMRTHAQKSDTATEKTPKKCSDDGNDTVTEEGMTTPPPSTVAEPDDDLSLIPKSWLAVISCRFCGKISCAPKHLRQHERRGTCTRNFQCDDCGHLFAKESNLMRHLKRHQREKTGDALKRFTCSVCNKKFKFEDNGLAHEKLCGRSEAATHKCSVCGKRFESKSQADQHWTCHHRSCVCHMCGQSFGKPESLKQHVKTVHEEFKMVCHYCGKEFSRKARLQEHLQHHTGQMDFTCHVCGKGSTNAYSFGVHLATHSQETPYTCSFCPRTFKHMKYVYLHERSVHLKLKSGKTYVKPKRPGKNVAQRTCPLCNKTFKRESAMLIHKRSVHEGKNGYICKICGKDFKYTYLLYVHKKKHHFPELCKYVCEFCEKPFPVKTELQNHLRKHTGEKPYACHICGKSYSFHGSLNMHMKTQHENKKNFKCDVCGSSYNFQSHLTRHMSAHADKYPAAAAPLNANL